MYDPRSCADALMCVFPFPRHCALWGRGYSLVGNEDAGVGAADSLIDGADGDGDAGRHREHFDRGRGRCGWLIGRCV